LAGAPATPTLPPVLTRGLPAAQVRRRVPLLVLAFAFLGAGVALMVRADLGLSPWDVLHQGVSEHTGIPIGMVGVLTGAAVLALWIPLRQRPGLATILNFLLIGTFVDLTLLVLPEDPSTPLRWAFMLVGVFLWGPGVAGYLACELGPGPRDGIMTAFVDRGGSLRVVRTTIEVVVLIIGFALGGTVGLGTVLFALTVGPNVHWFSERIETYQLRRPTSDPAPEPA
jgi:uncharacterized membrane protein YczE